MFPANVYFEIASILNRTKELRLVSKHLAYIFPPENRHVMIDDLSQPFNRPLPHCIRELTIIIRANYIHEKLQMKKITKALDVLCTSNLDSIHLKAPFCTLDKISDDLVPYAQEIKMQITFMGKEVDTSKNITDLSLCLARDTFISVPALTSLTLTCSPFTSRNRVYVILDDIPNLAKLSIHDVYVNAYPSTLSDLTIKHDIDDFNVLPLGLEHVTIKISLHSLLEEAFRCASHFSTLYIIFGYKMPMMYTFPEDTKDFLEHMLNHMKIPANTTIEMSVNTSNTVQEKWQYGPYTLTLMTDSHYWELVEHVFVRYKRIKIES